MKKNIAMRVAAILFILTMISTCAFSTTFAKYVTSGTADDSARVAKFGVTVGANSTTVATTEVGGSNEEHVKSATPQVILAPGTEVVELADFTITGTPEVAVNVSYSATVDLGENWIAGGAYYCPLEVTVNTTTFKGTDYSSATEFEAAIAGAISGLSDNYAVGTNLSGVLAPHVSVVWMYEGNDDVKDTALGDAATAPTLSLTITCTVTQID